MERTKRKLKTGIVTSDKSNKTRIVEVSRSFRHSFYDKVLKRNEKYYVHDEKNESHVGDQVKIAETRPLSKLKRWRLLEIIQKA
jgi:small subunit ribosomal protein S17